MGCDKEWTDPSCWKKAFQSTHPRGVRQQTYTKAHCCLCFQYTFSTNTCQFFGVYLLFFFTLPVHLAIFQCEPTGESLSTWTSHRPKMRVKLRYFKNRKKERFPLLLSLRPLSRQAFSQKSQSKSGMPIRKRETGAKEIPSCERPVRPLQKSEKGLLIYSPPFAAVFHPSHKPSYWLCSWGKT